MLSKAPAKLIGLEKSKGTVQVGKDADLVIADESFTVKKVLLSGIDVTN